MNILITGGSHVGALNLGHKMITPAEMSGINFHIKPLGGGISVAGRFFEIEEKAVVIRDPRYRRNIEQIPWHGTDFNAVGFSTVLYSRPIWYQKDWAKYGMPDFEPGRIPISKGMVKQLILDDSKHLIDLLVALKNMNLNPFVIEGPRPFRHNNEVRLVGASSVSFIDKLYRLTVSEILKQISVPIVELPPHTFDDDGFMVDKYKSDREDDGTHGNELFGLLMIKETISFLKKIGA